MAADNHNSWVEYDVAIAGIGKMIAEQNGLRNQLLTEFAMRGLDEMSEEVQDNKDYIRYTVRINELFKEIDMVYKGENLESIFFKVKNEYAPIIRERYNIAHGQVVV